MNRSPARRLALGTAIGALLMSACSNPSPDAGAVPGSGTISGTVDGRAFDSVGAAYLIGQPDDLARTTVVYVFDAPIPCDALSQPGWDQTVADNSQALEMKLIGQATGTFPIATDGRPSGGESDVNYTVTATSGTPTEVSATSGAVVLSGLAGSASADGSFELTFPGGSVSGDFAAVYCADAHEP